MSLNWRPREVKPIGGPPRNPQIRENLFKNSSPWAGRRLFLVPGGPICLVTRLPQTSLCPVARSERGRLRQAQNLGIIASDAACGYTATAIERFAGLVDQGLVSRESFHSQGAESAAIGLDGLDPEFCTRIHHLRPRQGQRGRPRGCVT